MMAIEPLNMEETMIMDNLELDQEVETIKEVQQLQETIEETATTKPEDPVLVAKQLVQ